MSYLTPLDSISPTQTNISNVILGAQAKTTPVDADIFLLDNSEASNILSHVTWANIKATLKTYFDTLYQVAGTYLTPTSTNTLTNKRITKRVGSVASDATPTINTDNFDLYKLSAQAVDITSFTTNLSGTPTDGQSLEIIITGTDTRLITWGDSFISSTVTLPTTTDTTVTLRVYFEWDSIVSKWVCVSKA